jgi:single-strand DNA-binding protein
MSIKNLCIFSGLVGQDPEMQYLANGSAIVKFGVASRKSWRRDDGEWESETTWFDCVAFGQKAERIISKVQKGTQVFVEAEYQKREVQDDETGGKRYFHNFKVQNIEYGKGVIEDAEYAPSSEGSSFDDESVPF